MNGSTGFTRFDNGDIFSLIAIFSGIGAVRYFIRDNSQSQINSRNSVIRDSESKIVIQQNKQIDLLSAKPFSSLTLCLSVSYYSFTLSCPISELPYAHYLTHHSAIIMLPLLLQFTIFQLTLANNNLHHNNLYSHLAK